jgi:hypothetical protein
MFAGTRHDQSTSRHSSQLLWTRIPIAPTTVDACRYRGRRVSPSLDGEFSEFESLMIDGHLRRSATCCSLARGDESATARRLASRLFKFALPVRRCLSCIVSRGIMGPQRWVTSVAAPAILVSLAHGPLVVHAPASLAGTNMAADPRSKIVCCFPAVVADLTASNGY